MSSPFESTVHISKLSTPSQFSRKSSKHNTKNKTLLSISETITYNKIKYNKEKSQYEDLSLQIIDKEQALETNHNKMAKLKRKLLLLMNTITLAFITHIIDLYPRVSKRVTDAIWAFLGFELAQSILMASVIQTEADMHNLIEMSMVYQKNKKKNNKVDSSYEVTKNEIKSIIDNCKNELLIYPFDILFEIFNYIYDINDLETKIETIYKSLNVLRKNKEISYSNMLMKEMDLNINEQQKEHIIEEIKLEEGDDKNNDETISNVLQKKASKGAVSEVKLKEEVEISKSSKKKKQSQITKKRNADNRYDFSLSTSMNSNQMFKYSQQKINSYSNKSQVISPIKNFKIQYNQSFENTFRENKMSLNRNTIKNKYNFENKSKTKDMPPFMKKANTHLSLCKPNRNNTLKHPTTTITTATAIYNKICSKSKDNKQMKTPQIRKISSLKSSNNKNANDSSKNSNNNSNNTIVKKASHEKQSHSLSETENQIKHSQSIQNTVNSLINIKESECLSEGFSPMKSYQIKEIKKNYYSDSEDQNDGYKVYNDNLIKDSAFIKQSKVDFGTYRKINNEKRCGCCVSCT